ncbi:Gram-positive signal peptide protein, YSIRK family [Streptococcus sp. oral taxon 056 str. F0418]|uniref:YSIRK signal domain/LPXTG anchor domain surface protein n=1 Tax=Streptococcus sp. oral taxon 056 TaxID=712620 RepID=UPI00021809CE|nr:YSIRK signal domain/LPXTG anchor domain surface protein [Streptococcus sp. oral taxon 056]EGP67199.1 Gram-positive signal peptide protein, YSIRK family [Streptococcus sp. oral taxon 056 str. F0418]
MKRQEREIRQRFSLRKYKIGVLPALIGTTLLVFGTATETLADHKVNYNFIDINNLSATERSLIIEGVPSGKVSSDEEIILVYKRVNGKRVFPKTGSRTNLLVEVGLAGATLGAAVYLRKSKKGRHTFFVMTILGTMVLGSHVIVADDYQSLLEQVTKIVKTDAELSQVLTPSEISNYQYIGYIRRKLPAIQKGTVNVYYRDRAGNSLAPMETAAQDGAVGQPYSTKSLFRQSIEKDGRTYNWVETQGEEKGTLSEGVANVIYVYEEVGTPHRLFRQ